MSTSFGPLWQLGYVVADLEPALQGWLQAGVGPWYVLDPLPIDRFSYRGGPSQVPRAAVALAYSGGVQIELIHQLDDTPTMYRDFLAATGGGLQHVGYLPADYDAACATADALGWSIGHDGEASGTRFRYYDTGNHAGSVIELVAPSAKTVGFFGLLRDLAASWDGTTDAVRRR